MTNQEKNLRRFIQALSITTAFGMANTHAGDLNLLKFDIQSQNIGPALVKLGESAGVQIMISQAIGDSIQLHAIKGEYTLRQALDTILADSGLVYEFASDDLVVVKKADANTARQKQVLKSEKMVIDEIVVTAEKRAESAQDLPIAISAFSGNTMENAGVTGISDLKQLAPSLQFGQGTGANYFVAIRGIGSDLSNIGGEPGVAISQDGIPFLNQYLFDADFFDVERVEVLRGPQGTIAGRNATGGAINIYSRQPSESFAASFKTTVGNYNQVAGEAYLSGPVLGDQVLGRIAVRTQRADGWLQNTYLNEDLNDIDKFQLKASLLARITENFTASLILDSLTDRTNRATTLFLGRARADEPSTIEILGIPGLDFDNLEYQADFPTGGGSRKNHKGILKLSWDIGSSANVTATTGYVSYKAADSSFDNDGTIGAFAHFADTTFVRLKQFSQELTLTADLSDKLDVILGTLYLNGTDELPIVFGIPDFGLPIGSLNLRPKEELTSYAIYTQWRYHLTDDLRISAGIRYTSDEKDYLEEDIIFGLSSITNANDNWNAFTPRLAMDFALTEEVSLYASISRGFKSGGYNTFGTLAGSPNHFEPETVWNYEAGIKTSGLDRRLRTALSVFYMDYKNLQQELLLSPPGGGVGVLAVRNAAAATIKGAEVEIEAFITDRLKISAASTYLDAIYNKLESVDQIYPELGSLDAFNNRIRDLSENRVTRAPKWQFNLSSEYILPVGNQLQMSLRGDYQWQDQVYFSFFNHDLNSQGAYGLLNFSTALGSSDERWQLAVFVRNAMDKRYVSHSAAIAGFGKDRTGMVGVPRMYGLNFSYKWE